MKLAFFGSGDFALASLDALSRAGLRPALVVTQPPRRRRRRGREEPTPVHAAADAAGLEVFAPQKINTEESLTTLRAAGADLFVVAEYGQILSRRLLAIPPQGTINVHGSLLPRWRGATPVAAAILAGDVETGVTIQQTVFELDAGPVLATRRIEIAPEDDTGTLTARLATLGGELVVDVVQAMAAGNPPAGVEQDEAQVTVCRRLGPGDAVVDWTRTAVEIERLVRAMRPRPGARTTLQRDPSLALEIRRAEAVAGAGGSGVVVEVARDHFDVAAGAGLLRVSEVVPAARRPMTARDFGNGYRLSAGERFS